MAPAAAVEDARLADPAFVERLRRLLGELAGFVDWLRETHLGAADPGPPPDSGINGQGVLRTLALMLARVLDAPGSLAEHYAAFARLALAASRQELDLEPAAGDRRFRDPLWRTSPLHRMLLQLYLAWQRTLGEWADAQRFTPADRQRVQFVLDQLVAALAPSNLPLNPAALKRAEATEGASAVQGLKAFADDVLHHGAMPRQIRPGAFHIGVDLATTEGAVVFRHPLFELIQYAPRAPMVHRRPILLVPPQVNKYYVFDLQPENSLLRWLLGQGFQVFTLSWCNPDATLRDAGLERYVLATLQAIEVVRSVARSATLGLISACAGGLTAIAALGLLAMRGERPVRHHSLFVTTPLTDNGSLVEAFAERDPVLAAAAWTAQRGTMDGADLARVFAWLRPDDLVWSYWVNNYLMGRQPPALDVLHWDNDPTRLTAALQRDFIDVFDRRVFERPLALTLAGTPIDFRRIKVDGYYVGGREDYLMPWRGVYRAARHFGARRATFVLSTSGHVQSILRPPRLGRVEHFVADALPASADEWLARAERRAGTWWPHWSAWLAARSGPRIKPRPLGSAAYPPLGAAPGEYVLQA